MIQKKRVQEWFPDEMIGQQHKAVTIITILYFLVAGIEVIGELYQYKPVLFVFKPLMPALLMLLYFCASKQKQILFFLAMFFSLVTNVLFIPNDPYFLYYGVLTFMMHRIVIIALIIRLVKPTDIFPVAIATIPYLLLFFYLLAITHEIALESYLVLIIQNILIAILGGLSLANYMMNDNRRNSWLLISSVLFVTLQFIVFLEKYYLVELSPGIFRPIAMGLNTFAFYTLYEFVMAIERSDNNGAAS
jgi:hypothetical protein